MKRIAWLVLLVGCFSFTLGGVALADPTEVPHWEWDEETTSWTPYDGGGGAGGTPPWARCFASGPRADGNCNKKFWSVDVDIHASVAQWVDWSLSSTRWDWFVMKPGKYVANCITYTLASNQDVTMTFVGFDDLAYTDNPKYADQKTTIDTYYAEGEYATVPGVTDWVRASALTTGTVYDSAALHDGFNGKLWIKIDVVPCNSACEYHDDAQIQLQLDCQKAWVDWNTGGWNWNVLPSP